VASDSKAKTDSWIQATGAEYAYAYGRGKLFGQVGARAYPSAVLVDATGTILYAGRPAGISDVMVSEAVQSALSIPIFDWPKELKSAASSLQKGKLGDALEKVVAKGDAHVAVTDSLRSMIEGRVGALRDAQSEGDWLRVATTGKDLVKSLEGLDEGKEVRAILAELKADKEAQVILKAQAKIAGFFEKRISSSKAAGVRKKIKKIAERFPADSVVARDAKRALKRLQ